MVVLKEITKTNDEISTRYYTEGREPSGFMRMRISDGEIIEHDCPDDMNMAYPYHAKIELKRLAKCEEPPKEWTTLWY